MKTPLRMLAEVRNCVGCKLLTKGRLANLGRSVLSVSQFSVFVMTMVMCADVSSGGSAIPGEEKTNFLYAITHLHPLAYLILFFIFALSVINLVFQARYAGRISLDPLPFSIRKAADTVTGASLLRGWARRQSDKFMRDSGQLSIRSRAAEHSVGGAVVGVPRMNNSVEQASPSNLPTPLEGINHPMPQFFETGDVHPASPRVVDGKLDQKPPAAEFRFSSSVGLPSPEEMERREREQLVISGFVRGSDGKGISSVLVYLEDTDGNRVGQSCRSDPETGEFKVLVSEAGKYFLKAYKRGFSMAVDGQLQSLPIECGKIEGLNVLLLKEGFTVKGRVISEDPDKVVEDLEVTCACMAEDLSRSTVTDLNGEYVLSGLPLRSECTIEVRRRNGEILAQSEAFQIAQKKEVVRDITIPRLSENLPGSVSDDSSKALQEFVGTGFQNLS